MPSLPEVLGYEVSHPNPLQRLVQRGASTRPGAWTLSRTLEPLDEVISRLTGRRHTMSSLVAGVPVITLHTTGARSGARRSHPLLGVPLDGTLAIIGTNYGTSRTPGWVYNLEADPRAEVTYRTTTVPIVARHADDTEAERAFERGTGLYPGFSTYRERVSNRAIRVFVLDHAG